MKWFMTFLIFSTTAKGILPTIKEQIDIPPMQYLEIVLPEGVPADLDTLTAKVVLDVLLHKYLYNTPGVDNALSLIPTPCLAHVSKKDIWSITTYFRAVNYFRIKYKVAKRMYRSGDCHLDRKYWNFWNQYLLDIHH